MSFFSLKTDQNHPAKTCRLRLTAYGSLSRDVSQKGCTNTFALSAAFRAASFQDFHPKALLSLSTILLQVSFGRPTTFLPAGVHAFLEDRNVAWNL